MLETHTEMEEGLALLAASRAEVLARVHAGRLDTAAVRTLADSAASLALTLSPMPIDPAAHVAAAHARARPYLERLADHDPAVAVAGGSPGYTYTPRKVLRRVLDHALDHLNQIEQWRRWRCDGVVPVPADGWAGSTTIFAEDHAPLSRDELAAWLWRIDRAVEAVVARAGRLSAEELDWLPPTDAEAWSLRWMLHHLAYVELFYVVWLDAALPEEPVARYAETSRRLEARLRALAGDAMAPGLALFDRGDGAVDAVTLARRVHEDQQAALAWSDAATGGDA